MNIIKRIDASQGTVHIDAELTEHGRVSLMHISYRYAAGLHQLFVHRGNHHQVFCYECYILDPAKDPLRTGSFGFNFCEQYPAFTPVMHQCIKDLRAELARCESTKES